jgi:hypothetical protein
LSHYYLLLARTQAKRNEIDSDENWSANAQGKQRPDRLAQFAEKITRWFAV